MHIIVRNRKAHFRYIILDKYEAGIVLQGTEVKSIRAKNVSISEAFCYIRDDEVFIRNMNVSKYKQGGYSNHDTTRIRKLLLHKREIKKIKKKIEQEGMTLIPLLLYFKNGLVKLEISLAKGKKMFDKRESIKKRDVDRKLKKISG